MITREQLKADLDGVADSHLEVLHRIIVALKPAASGETARINRSDKNPLKGSITFEKDIVSPVGESWSAER